MKQLLFTLVLSTMAVVPAFAEVGDKLQDDGLLNPQQLGIDYFANNYDFKKGDSIPCVYGYAASKMGDHDSAQKIFSKCVAAGVDAAYPWESYMSQNGYGTHQSLEDAAQWDRESAARGYKIGQYNYGLSLLRGFGVEQDVEAGKHMVDAAAAQGLDAAIDLKANDYDWQTAIPDADKPRIY
jgi:hypothetical protein